MSASEGKCPGCEQWVLIDSRGRLFSHRNPRTEQRPARECDWSERRPPETRARQLEMGADK